MKKILYIPTFNKKTNLDKEIVNKYPEMLIEKKPDIIAVSGGDGSLLHAIQDYRYLNKPFIGIANGTLNFLMNKISDINEITSVDNTYLDVYTIFVKVLRSRSNGTSTQVFSSHAINDIVIGAGIMDFNQFLIKDLSGIDSMKNVKGMGLVFSTPIGSTAFSYNNSFKLDNSIIKDLESCTIAASTIVGARDTAFNKHFNPIKPWSVEILSERSYPNIYIDGHTQIFSLKKGDIVIMTLGRHISLGFNNIGKFLEKRNRNI